MAASPSDERLSLALAVAATADRRRRRLEPARSRLDPGTFAPSDDMAEKAMSG